MSESSSVALSTLVGIGCSRQRTATNKTAPEAFSSPPAELEGDHIVPKRVAKKLSDLTLWSVARTDSELSGLNREFQIRRVVAGKNSS